MKKYTAFIYKFKKPLIALFIIMVVTAFLGLFKIKLNTDFSLFSTDNSVYETRLENVENVFGETNQIVLMIKEDNFDTNTIENLRELQVLIEEIASVKQIQGPTPEKLFIGGTLTTIANVNPEDLLSYYTALNEFSPLKELDGSYYYIYTIFIESSFDHASENELEKILDESNVTYYLSGDLYNQTKITDYILQILLVLPPLALVVIFLVFFSQMKSFKATLFSILPAAIGSLWTLGSVGWLGQEVSMLTAVVPIFIIVIGSADGLHFMSHFQDSKRSGQDTKTAISDTLEIVGLPMIVTTLTSMAGFIALLSMPTSSIVDLALYSAIGILLAGVATWYILPLILSNDLNVLPRKNSKLITIDGTFLKKLWGLPSYVIVLIIILLTALFMPKINNEFNMLMIYKDYTVVAQNADKIQEINGGAIPLYVMIELDESPTLLTSKNQVDMIAEDLASMDEVNKIINPYELLNIMFTFQSGQEEFTNNALLTAIYNTISETGTSPINQMINPDENAVRLLVFPSDMKNATLDSIESQLSSYDNVTITGVQYIMKDLNVSINQMQLYSILFALGLVLTMMVISLRSFKYAIYSILPIIITVLSIYAFLGISQIPLNITTVIIFSITIGVGIDYAVHFASVFRYYYKKDLNRDLAIEHAFSNTERPIIANALGISLGLSMLMFSPLTIHFNVSALMWVSMVVSVLMTLTLLPSVLRFGKDNKKGE